MKRRNKEGLLPKLDLGHNRFDWSKQPATTSTFHAPKSLTPLLIKKFCYNFLFVTSGPGMFPRPFKAIEVKDQNTPDIPQQHDFQFRSMLKNKPKQIFV